jgi:hypothetical protein
MKILHNHQGYALTGPKRALVQASTDLPGTHFALVDVDTREVASRGQLRPRGRVMRWRDWRYWEADFSALDRPGRYLLHVEGSQPPLVSRPFELRAPLYDEQHLSDLLHYFKSQRCTGIFDRADRRCPVHDSLARADVRGGWYDASGDVSKYLSHLSYANVMNPQQTPQLVWNLVDARSRLPAQPLWFDERIVDEALHGADFLLRMQHVSGFFYTTVFDRWTKDVTQRRLCAYATQQGHLLDRYKAGFRQGAGSAIAALARASRLPRDGEAPRAAYLEAARWGFAHLERHNLDYLDDNTENLIDDYCALLAATELLAATRDHLYRAPAEARVQRLLARQHAQGWFWVDDPQTRSYVHAAEAGMPCVALLRFLEVAADSALREPVRDAVRRAMQHELRLAERGEGNPFGLPRHWVVRPDHAPRAQFFMPHDNDSGYWWQGENARLASLAAAALAALPLFADEPALAHDLRTYAGAALDWIFGFNPFDACMMQGAGHNPPRYEPGYWNAPGGVCNGITSGLHDEDDIDFKRPDETDPTQSWRWSEQWLPHGAWLFLALAHWRGGTADSMAA